MLRKVEVSELKVLSCCIWVLCALTSVSPQDHSITQAGWHFHMSLVQPPVQSRVSCYLILAHSRLYPVWFWKHSKMNAEKLFQLNDVRSHFFFSLLYLARTSSVLTPVSQSLISHLKKKTIISLANPCAEFRRLSDMLKSHLLSKMNKFCSLSFSPRGSSPNPFDDSPLDLLKILTPFQ